jgi:hypothetical protein
MVATSEVVAGSPHCLVPHVSSGMLGGGLETRCRRSTGVISHCEWIQTLFSYNQIFTSDQISWG